MPSEVLELIFDCRLSPVKHQNCCFKAPFPFYVSSANNIMTCHHTKKTELSDASCFVILLLIISIRWKSPWSWAISLRLRWNCSTRCSQCPLAMRWCRCRRLSPLSAAQLQTRDLSQIRVKLTRFVPTGWWWIEERRFSSLDPVLSSGRNGMFYSGARRSGAIGCDAAGERANSNQTALFVVGAGAPESWRRPRIDARTHLAHVGAEGVASAAGVPSEPGGGRECSGCGGRGWKASVDVDAGEASRAGGALCRYCAFASNGTVSLSLSPSLFPSTSPYLPSPLSLSLSREQTTVPVQGCRLIGT